MTPPPPAPFPSVNRVVVPAGTVLHRIHSPRFGSDSFNPCQGRQTRFAPLGAPGGPCIPTAYLAQSFECAAHETVFHEVPHDALFKTVDADAVRELIYSTVIAARDLTFCTLFEPDLNRLGMTRRNLIDTLAVEYIRTAQWAIAIHDAHPDIDGLVWTSRRCDPERAYLMFGDRIPGPGITPQSSANIGTTPALMQDIRAFGERAGITLVV